MIDMGVWTPVTSRTDPFWVARNFHDSKNTVEGIQALCKLRCGNLERGNKYWMKLEDRKCEFCNKEIGKLEHYVNCEEMKNCFIEMGSTGREIVKN